MKFTTYFNLSITSRVCYLNDLLQQVIFYSVQVKIELWNSSG